VQKIWAIFGEWHVQGGWLSCLVLSSTCNWGCKCSALERAAVRLLPPTTLTMPWGCPQGPSDPCCGPLYPSFSIPTGRNLLGQATSKFRRVWCSNGRSFGTRTCESGTAGDSPSCVLPRPPCSLAPVTALVLYIKGGPGPPKQRGRQ
jgi:hypothetical protein